MYTHTDEAPMLATYSLLPVLRAYCRFAGVKIMKKAPWYVEGTVTVACGCKATIQVFFLHINSLGGSETLQFAGYRSL